MKEERVNMHRCCHSLLCAFNWNISRRISNHLIHYQNICLEFSSKLHIELMFSSVQSSYSIFSLCDFFSHFQTQI